MAQQLLDGPEVGASVEEVGGECVAERVNAESSVLVNLVQKGLHRVLDRAHADPAPGAGEEERGPVYPSAQRTKQLVTFRP